MVIFRVGTGFALAFALASCSSELVTKPFDSNKTAPTGMPYQMQFTQFDITLKWQAIECVKDDLGLPTLKIRVTAEATPKTANDPERLYYVDPRDLTGWTKKGESTFEWYQNRALKSANGSSEDQVGQAAINIATAVGKVVTILSAAGASKEKDKGPGPVGCRKSVEDAIAGASEAKIAVDEANRDVSVKTLKLARATARVAALGDTADRQSKKEKAAAILELDASTAALEIAKANLEQFLKKVTFQYTTTWPQNGSQRETTTPIALPPQIALNWSLNETKTDIPNYQVYFALNAPTSIAVPQSSTPETGWKGLPYREPVQATLSFCTNDPCGKGNSDEFASVDAMVLQMGPILVLPFEGRAFASNKATAVFSEDGALKSAGYTQDQSTLAGASDTVKSMTDQLAPAWAARHPSDLQQIENKTKLAKAEKDLAEAQAALMPGSDNAKQIKALEDELAIVQAETNLLNAKKALAIAKGEN